MHRITNKIEVQKTLKIAKIWCLVLGFVVLPVHQAHAYIDPVGGSILLQILLGGVAGLALLLKFYWHRFLSILGIRKEESDDSPVLQAVDVEPKTESSHADDINEKSKGERAQSS